MIVLTHADIAIARRWRNAIVWTCAAVMLAVPQVLGEPNFCREDLVSAARQDRLASETRYEPRGDPIDRCEGSYGELHSRGPLDILALWKDCQPSQTQSGGLSASPALAWATTSRVAAHLEVRSFDTTPYLMTTAVSSSTTFQWPNEILRALSLDRRKLGALAWYDDTPERKVYLPLEWTDAKAQSCAIQYRVLLTGVYNSDGANVSIQRMAPQRPPHQFSVSADYSGPRGWIILNSKDLSDGDGTYEVLIAMLPRGGADAGRSRGSPDAGRAPGRTFTFQFLPVNPPKSATAP